MLYYPVLIYIITAIISIILYTLYYHKTHNKWPTTVEFISQIVCCLLCCSIITGLYIYNELFAWILVILLVLCACSASIPEISTLIK